MSVYAALSPGLGSSNPSTIVRARVTLPFSGIFHVDLRATDVIEVVGPQTFTLDTLSLTCASTRSLNEVGSTGVRLVGGRAGWRTEAASKQYRNALVSTIVTDTANTVGEAAPIVANDGPIGSYFRTDDLASAVLDDLFGDGWWLDPTGVVQTAARDSSPITSGFQCMAVYGAAGRYVMGVDVIADWMPGRSFANDVVSGTIGRVTHYLEETSVRTEVLVTP